MGRCLVSAWLWSRRRSGSRSGWIGPVFPGRAVGARGHRPNSARSLPLPGNPARTVRPCRVRVTPFTLRAGPVFTTRFPPGALRRPRPDRGQAPQPVRADVTGVGLIPPG